MGQSIRRRASARGTGARGPTSGRRGRAGRTRRRRPTDRRASSRRRARPTCARAAGGRRRRPARPARRRGGRRRRPPVTRRRPPTGRAERRRLEQHQVAGGDRGAEARHRDVDRVDLGPLQPPHEAAALTERRRPPGRRDRRGAAAHRRSARASPGRRPSRRRAGVRELAGVGSSSISSAARHASPTGSFEVSTRADSHQSGPEAGWRSTMRRHAVTRPGGSKPSDASAPAVSLHQQPVIGPGARAT